MKWTKIVRVVPILPAAWISSKIYEKREQEQAQIRLEKWSRFLLRYLGYDLCVRGQENVPQQETIYFVSNHQGTLDPALVLASCPVHLAFISKKENETMPIFGRWARNIGTIHFDRDSREGNVHMLREAARELKQKKNLLVFPEGTRSKGDAMNEFKAGSLLPAYLTKATIVPVVLKNAYTLDVGTSHSKKLEIEYGKPIRAEEYKKISQEDLAKDLHDWIQSRIEISPEDKTSMAPSSF